MKPSVITFFAGIAFSCCAMAQANDPVLMKINGKPVSRSEFEYIYNKNNSNNSLDKKTLEEYVDLFINFKLKVEEAKAQGIDTTKSFVSELAGYRTQLTKPFLTDSKVDDKIVAEAYERMKEDVDVSHILIRIADSATPSDTLKAWNEINAVYKRLQKEDFGKVAKEVSQDPSVKDNSGRLGFITAFRTVYAFETQAYNTAVGAVSKPFRTAFGYHILKVHARRNTLGEVLVAHIMKMAKKGDEESFTKAKTAIDSLSLCLKKGDDFGALAVKYSEDKGSASKNGELPWFGSGRMIPEFETAAFALGKIGDVSVPVRTAFGWHLIKMINKRGIADFQELKAELERKVKRDERGTMSQKAFLTRLRTDYNCKINNAGVQELIKLNPKSLTDSVFLASAVKLKGQAFSFADKTYTQADLMDYIKKNNQTQKSTPAEMIDEKLNAYIDAELYAYEDASLEKKHDDFRFLMQEYHDGILLFEVSNREVWDKASKDLPGLTNYFNNHKNDYKWEKPHYKGLIISCKDSKTLKAAKQIVKNSPVDSLEKYLRVRLNDSVQYVKVERGLYVQGDNKVIDKEVFKVKSDYAPAADYPFVFVVGKQLKNLPEDYTDVRGLVTADYQEFLEKEWIKHLREKYPVEVDQNILKTVKKN